MNNYQQWQLEKKGNILSSDGHSLLFPQDEIDPNFDPALDTQCFGEETYIFNQLEP